MNERDADEPPIEKPDAAASAGRSPAAGSGPVIVVDGRRVVNLASDDLLGFSLDERCVAAARRALEEDGAGSAPPRGRTAGWPPHRELEERLALFVGFPGALLAPSGYDATVIAVGALAGEGDVVVADRRVGPAAADGAAIAGAVLRTHEHRDVDEAGERLGEAIEEGRGAVLATEGLFGDAGSIAPLPELAEIAREHGVPLLVDDALGLGVLGDSGRGTLDHFGEGPGSSVTLWTGSLAKALGGHGGCLLSEPERLGRIRDRSRRLAVSAGPPAAGAAAAGAAIGALQENPRPLERLWENAGRFRDRLEEIGFDFGVSETPILSIRIPGAGQAAELARRLFAAGVLVQVAGSSAGGGDGGGDGRIRLTVRADHEADDLDRAVEALQETATELLD